MAMDSIPEAMLVRAVVRWRCTATSNVDAPQGVVRLVQAHSLEAYWQTWPHVAARRSRGCRGRGRVLLGLRQVPHRLSVRWVLSTVMMAVQLLLSTSASLLAGAGERGQVRVP